MMLDVYIKVGTHIEYKNLSEDQEVGLAFAISQLKENEEEVVKLRYREGLIFQNIGVRIGRSRDHACRIMLGL